MAGGIYEQSEWPDSRWDCVTVCDGCYTVVWGTFWDDYDSAARDAYFARNGWRNYCVPGDTEILELCPDCAVRALRRGETRGLADTWLRPGVAERLDLRSEAFAPMLPDDRDPFDDGCMLGESLSYLCGMDPARPGAVYERLGYAKGWLDEGRAYQTVLSPYAYVRRPDRSIVVSDDCWDALIEVFDVPDEQALDCLCLAIRCGGAWPVDGEGGGAMV